MVYGQECARKQLKWKYLSRAPAANQPHPIVSSFRCCESDFKKECIFKNIFCYFEELSLGTYQ